MSQRRRTPVSHREFIHVFGNENRVQILAYLWECDPAETTDVARETDTLPSTLRPHLKKLQEVGLLQQRKRDGTTFWQLTMNGEKAAGKVARPMLEVAPEPE